MLEQQHFLDLEQHNGGVGDPESQLPDPLCGSSSHAASSDAPGGNGNVDRVLFKNLVEMVPLVESLMDRRATSSFTRRGSLVYTRTPAKESNHKKVDANGMKTQRMPAKRRGGDCEADPDRKSSSNCMDTSTVRALVTQKDGDTLHRKVEDLQKKLAEKEEILKSAQDSMNQMKNIEAKLTELKSQIMEKDLLIKSYQLQLSDARVKLADKQAALEKLQWEAATSNDKVEELQQDLNSLQNEGSLIMHVIEALTGSAGIDDVKRDADGCDLDHLPHIEQEEPADEVELRKMEAATQAYIAAVIHAKDNPCEKTMEMAAKARFTLQSFVLKSSENILAMFWFNGPEQPTLRWPTPNCPRR